MALFSTNSLKSFDEVEGVNKNVKLGDKIYSGDATADYVAATLNKYKYYYTQKTIDVAGKNVHEFTIRIKPVETLVVAKINHMVLLPEYEVELAS